MFSAPVSGVSEALPGQGRKHRFRPAALEHNSRQTPPGQNSVPMVTKDTFLWHTRVAVLEEWKSPMQGQKTVLSEDQETILEPSFTL